MSQTPTKISVEVVENIVKHALKKMIDNKLLQYSELLKTYLLGKNISKQHVIYELEGLGFES